MKIRFLFLALIFVISPLWAQQSKIIAQSQAIFEKGLGEIAKNYNSQLSTFAEEYVLDLRQLAITLKKDDPKGSKNAKEEAARFLKALMSEPDPFESVPELTKEQVLNKPEGLRILQEEYIGRRSAHELERNAKIVELGEKFAAGLNRAASLLKKKGSEEDAEALLKEMRKIKVAMQSKDFAVKSLRDAKISCLPRPPQVDLGKLKTMVAKPKKAQKNIGPATLLTELPSSVQAFLMKPLEYDHDWPPEITKWRFEGKGSYSHDFSYYNLAGLPNELGIYAQPKNLRGYVQGTIEGKNRNFRTQHLEWVGKAMSWRLNDSRDLVCRVAFRTKKPSSGETAGPAACVAVYSIDENNKLIASMTTPMVKEETVLFMAKHYSYNRMNIKWEGSKRKRGFTIPDHTPLRVIVGVVGHMPGEQIDATIEVMPTNNLGEE